MPINITLDTVIDTQKAWIEGLLAISRAHASGEDARAVAEKILSDYYDYDEGNILFKPTLASGAQTFRLTKACALSYFVGGNPDFPDDAGFALKPFTAGTVEVAGFLVRGDVVIAQSKIGLEMADGSSVEVDKTFTYRVKENGQLVIIAHHSSIAL
jgi:hypothetical protein